MKRIGSHHRTALMAAIGLFTAFNLSAQTAPSAPPGFSAMDLSRPEASNQSLQLAPIPVPPLVIPPEKIPVSRITLPQGFRAEIWSWGHPGARTMVMGDRGTMFMGTRGIGRVYAITGTTGKRQVRTIASGLNQPNGLAFKDGSLYVFVINRVFRYDGIEDKLDNPGQPVDLTAQFNLPTEVHHNWKYVAFGPDGKLYVQIGANCNICEFNPGIHGQIRRYNADGSGMEIVARGVRDTQGFDWHPATGELWFTDNGRDWAGNDGFEDEVNRIPKGMEGANFGFPYCHANGQPDPDLKRPNPCAGVIMPAALNGAHTAGLGLRFYTGAMLPTSYRNVAFIARHGSWNREKKSGYDVVIARPLPDGTARMEPFLGGLMDNTKNEFYGRPAHVFQLQDGSILVSDEQNVAVYRIIYDAELHASAR